MRKRLIASLTAVLMFLLLFSACGFSEENSEPEQGYSGAPTISSPNTDSDYGGDIPDEPETAGVKLGDDELYSLGTMLFGDRYGDNWYYKSVPVLWSSESPADINLYELFYNGFSGECGNFTDEEVNFLALQSGLSYSEIESMGQFRLPQVMMDSVLREYYGIALMETNLVGLDNCIYWSETNSYYVLRNDTANIYIGLHSAYEQDDGGFIIYYSYNEKQPAPEYVMELEPNEYGSYTIIMNKPVS